MGYQLEEVISLTDNEAGVIPYKPWKRDGTANVTPLPPYPDNTPKVLPFENLEDATYTIERSKYPYGLILIRKENPPDDTLPTVLPLKPSTENQESVRIGDKDYPNGVVVLFH